jgi:hypothetical protein
MVRSGPFAINAAFISSCALCKHTLHRLGNLTPVFLYNFKNYVVLLNPANLPGSRGAHEGASRSALRREVIGSHPGQLKQLRHSKILWGNLLPENSTDHN